MWIEAGAGTFFQNTHFYPITEMLRQLLGVIPAENQLEQLATRLTAPGLKPAEALPLIAPLSIPKVATTTTIASSQSFDAAVQNWRMNRRLSRLMLRPVSQPALAPTLHSNRAPFGNRK